MPPLDGHRYLYKIAMAKQITYHGKYKGTIVSQFSVNKIRKGLEKKKKEVENLIIKQFSYIGEQCVKIAREQGSYNDITGNLRSSIGYVVLNNGKPVKYGEPKQYNGKLGNGAEGAKAAEALLTKLQAKFPWGIVLIVCAGMNYAAYVENIHHKDVLSSAELKAESLAKQLLKGIIEK